MDKDWIKILNGSFFVGLFTGITLGLGIAIIITLFTMPRDMESYIIVVFIILALTATLYKAGQLIKRKFKKIKDEAK